MTGRKVVVGPDVSRQLGALLADADGVAYVLGELRENLLQRSADYRLNRDEEDPDFLFDVPIRLLLRGRWRFVRFSVNDTTSPDHFIVEAVSMSG
jgi:hypothetical protein